MTDFLARAPNLGRLAGKIAPFLTIALAWLAVRTPLAEAYPRTAALLFLWIVADSLTLPIVARARRGTALWQPVLAALAAAGASAAIGLPAPVREALWAMPAAMVTIVAIVGAHCLWGLVRAGKMLRSSGDWRDALSQLFPAALVRFAASELALLRLALFSWGAAPDVPPQTRAFAYHRYLTPMAAVLLALQVIEIGVVHVLVSIWSPRAALILFVLSVAGVIYMIGLIKSFRLRPVLITPQGVRIRMGLILDQTIPFEAIAEIRTQFGGEAVKAPATRNLALLAWPNLLLELRTAMPRSGLFKRPPTNAIALRLDEPAAFARLLAWRLGQPH